MASLLPSIPMVYMNPRQKWQLMNYLVESHLPSRITRQVLAAWGAELGVDITSTDYELLNSHSLIQPGPNPRG